MNSPCLSARVCVIAGALIVLLSSPLTSHAVNHVRIDNISNVPPGTTDLTIGAYFTNDIRMIGVAFAFEIRTCNAGAYITGPKFVHGMNPVGRMYNSPLGPADPNGAWPAASVFTAVFAQDSLPNAFRGCVRPHDSTRSWVSSFQSAAPDYISPDAVFLATVSTGDPRIGQEIAMAPGSDPPGVPSYRLIVNVGTTPGIFVIDTTCTTPRNVLQYVDPESVGYFPTFEMGVIGVGVAAGPCSPAGCDCPCHGEPGSCVGEKLGVLDVIQTIDVAFRAVPAVQSPACPYTNTDVDCSGGTDIVDVVRSVNVEFRNADRATEYCHPCSL